MKKTKGLEVNKARGKRDKGGKKGGKKRGKKEAKKEAKKRKEVRDRKPGDKETR